MISCAKRYQALPIRFYFSLGRGESLGTRLPSEQKVDYLSDYFHLPEEPQRTTIATEQPKNYLSMVQLARIKFLILTCSEWLKL